MGALRFVYFGFGVLVLFGIYTLMNDANSCQVDSTQYAQLESDHAPISEINKAKLKADKSCGKGQLDAKIVTGIVYK